jgi:hypothetical protein
MRKRSHVVLPLFLGSVFVYAAYATWRTENLHGRHQRYAYALGAIRALGLKADARPGAVSRVPVENTSNASATWRAKDLHGRHMPNQQHAHAPGTPRVVDSTSSSGQKTMARVAVASSKNSSVSWVKRPKIIYFLHLHKSGLWRTQSMLVQKLHNHFVLYDACYVLSTCHHWRDPLK